MGLLVDVKEYGKQRILRSNCVTNHENFELTLEFSA